MEQRLKNCYFKDYGLMLFLREKTVLPHSVFFLKNS